MRRLLVIALLSGLTLPWSAAAIACGYHDPAQVAAGILNWVYPKALHVRTAVWQAERAGLLAPGEANAPKDPFVLQRVAARLQKLAEHVSLRGRVADGPRAFSVLLIDSMMWTRFLRHDGTPGLTAIVHVAGPGPGDVVIVSHSKVVSELAMQTLTAEDARTHGLIRYYGPDGDVAWLKHVLETSLSARRTVASQPSN
jgi:hypothetical protein